MGPMYAVQQPLAMAQPTTQRVRTPFGWITVNVQPQIEVQSEVHAHRRHFSRSSMSGMCQADDAMMGGAQDMVMDEAMDVQMATPVFFDASCNKRKRAEDDQPMWRSEGKIRRIAAMRGPSSIMHQQQTSFFPSPFQVATGFQSSPFGTPTKQPFGAASCFSNFSTFLPHGQQQTHQLTMEQQ